MPNVDWAAAGCTCRWEGGQLSSLSDRALRTASRRAAVQEAGARARQAAARAEPSRTGRSGAGAMTEFRPTMASSAGEVPMKVDKIQFSLMNPDQMMARPPRAGCSTHARVHVGEGTRGHERAFVRPR